MYYPFTEDKQSCFGKMDEIRKDIFVSDNPQNPESILSMKFYFA